ncbi:hypothetical protein ACIPMW_34490 [Streptomyces sp. NPDC086669]|uniref:hypothetical protein n=1 Tax=Streptomyces sp. NPDC086669 TaxID=3365753 RepID=UPI00380C8D8F
MSQPSILRTAALVVSSALRDDDQAARLLLHTLPPDHIKVTCEAAIFAMAELVREFVPAEAIQAAIRDAQQMAQNEATGRN